MAQKIEDDDFPLEVGQRLEAGEGGPFEVELGGGFSDEGGARFFGFGAAIKCRQRAVRSGGGFGARKIDLQPIQQRAHFFRIIEHLSVERCLHEENLGHVVSPLGGVFGEQGIERGKFGGEIGGGGFSGPELGLDLIDQNFEVGDRRGGRRSGFLSERGDERSERKEKRGEEWAVVHG